MSVSGSRRFERAHEVEVPNADTVEALQQAESGVGLTEYTALEGTQDRVTVSHAPAGDQSLRERPQAGNQRSVLEGLNNALTPCC